MPQPFEQEYDEAIIGLANQLFFIPYDTNRAMDIDDIVAEAHEFLNVMAYVFQKNVFELIKDVKIAMLKIPVDDAEQALKLRKENRLN